MDRPSAFATFGLSMRSGPGWGVALSQEGRKRGSGEKGDFVAA